VQNAKDSFYVALRNRLATVDPARVMELRSVTRPSIMLEEAESPMACLPEDTFVLRWTGTDLNGLAHPPFASMVCEIFYTTGGTKAGSGLDRGRELTAMDQELLAILHPSRTAKFNYATTPATQMDTQIFWTEPTFKPLVSLREQLQRTVVVTVLSLFEQGEQ
jgi:hypothetical protein